MHSLFRTVILYKVYCIVIDCPLKTTFLMNMPKYNNNNKIAMDLPLLQQPSRSLKRWKKLHEILIQIKAYVCKTHITLCSVYDVNSSCIFSCTLCNADILQFNRESLCRTSLNDVIMCSNPKTTDTMC